QVRGDGVETVGNRFRHVLAPFEHEDDEGPRRGDNALSVPCLTPQAAARGFELGDIPDSSPNAPRAGKTGGEVSRYVNSWQANLWRVFRGRIPQVLPNGDCGIGRGRSNRAGD